MIEREKPLLSNLGLLLDDEPGFDPVEELTILDLLGIMELDSLEMEEAYD